MINKEMNNNSDKTDQKEQGKETDEQVGFYFSSSIKIFDPNNEEILVQKRGDN